MQDECEANIALLPSLYGVWAKGEPEHFALLVEGAVYEIFDILQEARHTLLALSPQVSHALIVALWPLAGWRHPRFVVESYRRVDAVPSGECITTEPLMRNICLAEQLRPVDVSEARETPYLLIKDGDVIGRHKRVIGARQAVDAALPPIAPVLFTSLRLGQLEQFSIMIFQTLMSDIATR